MKFNAKYVHGIQLSEDDIQADILKTKLVSYNLFKIKGCLVISNNK